MDAEFRLCIVCRSEGPTLLFVKDEYSIVRCKHCGLVYVGEELESIDFEKIYGESYYTGGSHQVFSNYLGEERSRRASARRRVWALQLLKRSGRLLDVGCAAGFFLAEARRYYEVQGVELSEFSSTFARDRFGLDVFTGTLQQAELPSRSFDLVTLWDVIEHVPDPDAVLAEAARLLKADGRLILTTGDIGSSYAQHKGSQWHLLAPPWHMYYFSRNTIAKLGSNVGLRVAGCQARGVAGDCRLARTRIGVGLSNFLGLGDIMRMTFAPQARKVETQ